MKLLEFPTDIVISYIKLKYPNKIICVLYNTRDYFNYSAKLAKLLEIELQDIAISDIIFLEFDNSGDAINFCNSVPDSEPYCIVVEYGEVIHENT